MKKEKTVKTYQRRTKSGKMVTVREHKASYDASEEARKAAAKKAGAGSELSKKKTTMEESPLGFSADDYREWYHWDMDADPKNEAALRVEKALTKKMGKKAYNKYLEDMTNSYSARGHKKAHQALLDEHTASQKKQDAESAKAAKDIARGAKEKSPTSSNDKENRIRKYSDHVKHLLQLNKLGEKDPMMGSYISEQKKILQDLKKYKGELLSPSEIGVTTDSFAKKHKLSYEEDGIYSDKSGKTYRISTNPITGKSTLHPMVGSTIGATTPKKKVKDSDLVEHYDQFNRKSMGKAVGDAFTFSEGRGKDKVTYDARFVTDGRGRYGYVVRDKAEGPSAKYYVGISDGYELPGSLPAGLRKAAKAQGLTFKGGEFVKVTDKSSSAKKPTSTKAKKPTKMH